MVRKSGVVEPNRLADGLERLRSRSDPPADPPSMAEQLIGAGLLTRFQVEHLLQGRFLGFRLGSFVVLELLGSGGMSAVYLCERYGDRQRAAVKVLPRMMAKDPILLKRFQREARASVALDHPNIVRGFEVGQEKDQHFFVMEYVEGESLQELVSRNGPLPVEEAVEYIRQAAVGLQYAHEAGLVHRDIKPGNLLVDREGGIKILDMGLSRFYNGEDDSVLTKDILGTLDYLAPEQARDSHEVDIRADIFSLGGTFYFLLTGQSPLGTGNVDQALAPTAKEPQPITDFRNDVPEALLAVIAKMMARDLEKRYHTPAGVVRALKPWSKVSVPEPPPSTPSTPAAPRPRTSKIKLPPQPAPQKVVPLWVVFVGILLGIGIGLAIWWFVVKRVP